MHRLFLPSIVLLALTIPLQIASLWFVSVGSPTGATRLWVSQGCLWFAHLTPSNPAVGGVHVGGWSGSDMEWTPRITMHERVWTTLPGGGGVATPMLGQSAQLPLCFPLGAAAAGACLSFGAYRRAWRRSRADAWDAGTT